MNRLIWVVVLLASTLLPSSATAASGSLSGSDSGGDDDGRLVLVLDASGSMAEATPSGQTRIEAAKSALTQVVASLPQDQPVGLRVYGAEVASSQEPGACTDSQLVVPVETKNRDQLSSAIGAYTPLGDTPTGYALQEAGQDLGDEGKRSIVLVSDGEPTCDPDPCVVAAELAQNGVEVTIDVVGLDVSGAARDSLQCVAREGGGSYYDADSAEELAASLEKLATRASRDYATIGTPVTGTADPSDAPEVHAGDWVDSLPAASTRTYRVAREIADSTIHVGATMRSDLKADDVLKVELTNAEGQSCGGDGVTAERVEGALLTASAIASDSCSDGDVVVRVERQNGVEPRPVELRVVEEPSVLETSDLPEPETPVTWRDPAGDVTGETVGGASFVDAPLLEPGTYTDTIVPGEALTYQVDADWGQQVVATVEYPVSTGRLADEIGIQDLTGTVAIVNPARARAGLGSLASGAPPSQTLVGSAGGTLGSSTAPIAYLNRDLSGSPSAASIAGRYTVVVGLEDDPEGTSYLVPVTLRIDVIGEPGGEPQYAEEPADPDEASSSEPLADGTGVPAWFLAVAVGVLVLGLVIGLGLLLARQRRSARSTPPVSPEHQEHR